MDNGQTSFQERLARLEEKHGAPSAPDISDHDENAQATATDSIKLTEPPKSGRAGKFALLGFGTLLLGAGLAFSADRIIAEITNMTSGSSQGVAANVTTSYGLPKSSATKTTFSGNVDR